MDFKARKVQHNIHHNYESYELGPQKSKCKCSTGAFSGKNNRHDQDTEIKHRDD